MIYCKKGLSGDVLSVCRGNGSVHCFVLTESQIFEFLKDIQEEYGHRYVDLSDDKLIEIISEKLKVDINPYL